MSSDNKFYDELTFKKSIDQALISCETIRNDIRHYKMHLMADIVAESITIDSRGLIHPQNKNNVCFGDILINDTGIIAGPDDSKFYDTYKRDRGIPLLVNDYFINQHFNADDYSFIDPQLIIEKPDYRVTGGDILMIQKGGQAGSCTVLPLTHAESLLGPGCIRISIIHDRYDVFFIINLLHFYYYQNISVFRSPEGIDIDKLLTLPIPAMTIDRQKEVALQMLEFSAFMVALDVYRNEMGKLRQMVNDAER